MHGVASRISSHSQPTESGRLRRLTRSGVAKLLWKNRTGDTTPRASARTQFTNGSGSGLRGSCDSILRKPAHRGRPFLERCRLGCPLKVYDFPGAIRLFLVAHRAAKIEDLRFSLGGFRSVVRRCLLIIHNGRNWNRRLAVQADYPAECLMLGFGGHKIMRSSHRLGFWSWGSRQSYSKGSYRSSHVNFDSCGNGWKSWRAFAKSLSR